MRCDNLWSIFPRAFDIVRKVFNHRLNPRALGVPIPIPFLINPGCVAGSCVVVAAQRDRRESVPTVRVTNLVFSRVTVACEQCVRRAPSPEKRAFVTQEGLRSGRVEVAR